MNKTAKEMFEELGFKLFKEDEYKILYSKYKITISFWKQSYYYLLECNFNDKRYNPKINKPLKLLQAINKQIEELGWNNE